MPADIALRAPLMHRLSSYTAKLKSFGLGASENALL
jgi:hypothetical protein